MTRTSSIPILTIIRNFHRHYGQRITNLNLAITNACGVSNNLRNENNLLSNQLANELN